MTWIRLCFAFHFYSLKHCSERRTKKTVQTYLSVVSLLVLDH